jgi:hypothetical protein
MKNFVFFHLINSKLFLSVCVCPLVPLKKKRNKKKFLSEGILINQ